LRPVVLNWNEGKEGDAMNANDMVTVQEVYLEVIKSNLVVLREEKDSEYYFMMFVGDAFAAIAKEKGLWNPAPVDP
jgi:hypothetical protein